MKKITVVDFGWSHDDETNHGTAYVHREKKKGVGIYFTDPTTPRRTVRILRLQQAFMRRAHGVTVMPGKRSDA